MKDTRMFGKENEQFRKGAQKLCVLIDTIAKKTWDKVDRVEDHIESVSIDIEGGTEKHIRLGTGQQKIRRGYELCAIPKHEK